MNQEVYQRGEAIEADLAWSGAPAGASIVVYLERDGRPPEGRRYMGRVGPLVLVPTPVSGDGRVRFRWNGEEFPCAPTDVPIFCPGTAEIGRYRLRAALYREARFGLVGWPNRTEPTVLSHTLSPAFVVRGAPDLQPIARAMLWGALNQLMAAKQIGASDMLEGSIIDGGGVTVLEHPGDRLCARIETKPPYESSVLACVAKAEVLGDAGLLLIESEEVEVSGDVWVTEDALSREQAIAAARRVADPPYRDRVAFDRQPTREMLGYDRERDGDYFAWKRENPVDTSHLSDSVGTVVYRPDLGGAWVVEVHELMAGDPLPGTERFADKVQVLVNAYGAACVIETVPYRGGTFRLDARTSAFDCPGSRAP